MLRSDGRPAEADRLLAGAAEKSPGDAEIVRRRFALCESAGDLPGAARLLVLAAAHGPTCRGNSRSRGPACCGRRTAGG